MIHDLDAHKQPQANATTTKGCIERLDGARNAPSKHNKRQPLPVAVEVRVSIPGFQGVFLCTLRFVPLGFRVPKLWNMALNKGIWDPTLRGTNIKGTSLKSLRLSSRHATQPGKTFNLPIYTPQENPMTTWSRKSPNVSSTARPVVIYPTSFLHHARLQIPMCLLENTRLAAADRALRGLLGHVPPSAISGFGDAEDSRTCGSLVWPPCSEGSRETLLFNKLQHP